MLLKLGSKKTRAAWGRKLFKYQKWLVSKKIFPDVEALLDDYKNAKNEDGKNRHLGAYEVYHYEERLKSALVAQYDNSTIIPTNKELIRSYANIELPTSSYV